MFQVEITCRGQPVVSSLPLESVRNIWFATAAVPNSKDQEDQGQTTASETTTGLMHLDTSSAKELIMVLTYQRHRRNPRICWIVKFIHFMFQTQFRSAGMDLVYSNGWMYRPFEKEGLQFWWVNKSMSALLHTYVPASNQRILASAQKMSSKALVMKTQFCTHVILILAKWK